MTEISFYFVTGLALVLFYWLNRSTQRANLRTDPIQTNSLSPQQSLIYALCWLTVLSLVALSGRLSNLTRFPPPIMPVMLLTTLATTALALSRYGKRLATTGSLFSLIALHSFRFPLELVLHALYKSGKIPRAMTFAGMNYDILTGVSSILLASLLWWKHCNRKARKTDHRNQTPLMTCGFRIILWTFNIIGIGLLITIVTIAVLSMPLAVFERIRPFNVQVVNTLPIEYPSVWLPLFLVQLAWFGHLLLFRRLCAKQNR